MAAPTDIAVAFGRVLRGSGMSVPVGCVLTFAEALVQAGVDRRETVYWSGRATLVRRPEDIEVYDRAFDVFWSQRQLAEPPLDVAVEQVNVTLLVDEPGGADDDADDDDRAEEGDGEQALVLRFSALEVLRHKDFSTYTAEELVLAQQLMARMRFVGAPRRSLRLTPSSIARRPDVRRTLRAALRAGGEPMRRAWRAHGERQRRLVLLLDVSGSMEPYARALLRFVHAAVAGRQRVEAFALGTRLTRMTRELASRDPDVALARAADRVVDWSGGTRLGEGLRAFNDLWGVRGMARGAIVVVLSDGWDRGDPTLLAEQMERLQRVTHSLIWVNPLKVTPGYAPLARGMAAALPYVDHFVEGHSLDAMEQLARAIGSR